MDSRQIDVWADEGAEGCQWKEADSYEVQQFEELRQKYHEICNKYQSKLSIEKDNLLEIEELRSCLENEIEERKKVNLKYEEESRRREIQWKDEMELIRAEKEDNEKIYKEKIEALENELAAMKKLVEKEGKTAAEMRIHVEQLTEAMQLEAGKAKELEITKNELLKECSVLKEKLSTEQERLTIKEEEVERLKEKLEGAFEEAAMYSSQMQEMKGSLLKEEEPAELQAKGNSLFAEVEDNRQRMKHLLALERRKSAKLQRAYQLKYGRVKHLEEELIEISRKWKDDLRETAVTKENLISSYKTHIKDLEDKIKRLETQGSVADNTYVRGMVSSPIEELKRIETEMEKNRKEADELREKLTSASLERLLRDQDLCELKAELRRLRAENSYFRKLSERNNAKSTTENQGCFGSADNFISANNNLDFTSEDLRP